MIIAFGDVPKLTADGLLDVAARHSIMVEQCVHGTANGWRFYATSPQMPPVVVVGHAKNIVRQPVFGILWEADDVMRYEVHTWGMLYELIPSVVGASFVVIPPTLALIQNKSLHDPWVWLGIVAGIILCYLSLGRLRWVMQSVLSDYRSLRSFLVALKDINRNEA